jgi:hypothetical protein
MGQPQPLEPEREPGAALGPVPGRHGPRNQGPCPAHVSAVLAIYVCILYANLLESTVCRSERQ